MRKGWLFPQLGPQVRLRKRSGPPGERGCGLASANCRWRGRNPQPELDAVAAAAADVQAQARLRRGGVAARGGPLVPPLPLQLVLRQAPPRHGRRLLRHRLHVLLLGGGAGTGSGPRRGATSSSSASSASSGRASLAAARASLPDPPVLYPFQELAAATNSFLAKRAGGGAYWRCSLRGRDAALVQLPRRPGAAVDAAALARVGRYHHTSLARLLGACPAGAHLYLAYELPPGAATLAACLRGPRNPGFTALRTWVSRVQVAADVAQGLEYVHHHAGAVHGRVSPSAVVVSDPGLRARLTHLGAAEFAAPASSSASRTGTGAPGSGAASSASRTGTGVASSSSHGTREPTAKVRRGRCA